MPQKLRLPYGGVGVSSVISHADAKQDGGGGRGGVHLIRPGQHLPNQYLTLLAIGVRRGNRGLPWGAYPRF